MKMRSFLIKFFFSKNHSFHENFISFWLGLQKARDILAERTEIAEQECQEHFQTHQLTEKLEKEGQS